MIHPSLLFNAVPTMESPVSIAVEPVMLECSATVPDIPEGMLSVTVHNNSASSGNAYLNGSLVPIKPGESVSFSCDSGYAFGAMTVGIAIGKGTVRVIGVKLKEAA